MRGLLVALPCIVFSLPVACFAVYRSLAQAVLRARTAITSDRGIDALESVVLGGVRQWILIRGVERTNPPLLWLHGGPGTPTMGLAHRHDTGLTRHFVVVHWDQRGAGKSYSARLSPGSMTVEQFVSDTLALVEHLRRRFGATRVYLIGHSWGAQIGALAVARRPELFFAYVGVGPAISDDGHRIGYAAMLNHARTTGNAPALEALEALGPPPWRTFAQLATYARWTAALGGTTRQYPLWRLVKDVVLSPIYSLKDVYNFFRGQQFSLRALLANGEIYRVNLFAQAARLDAPVYLFQGRHDYNTPGELVERYHRSLDAPQGKTLLWFERSAHFPQWEEPDKFAAEMVRVLDDTYHRSSGDETNSNGRAPNG